MFLPHLLTTERHGHGCKVYKGRVMVMRLINLILGMARKGSAAAVDNEYKTTNQPGPGSEAGRGTRPE